MGPSSGQRTHPPSGNTTSEVNQTRCPQVARATWNLLVAGVRDAGSAGFAEVAGTDREKNMDGPRHYFGHCELRLRWATFRLCAVCPAVVPDGGPAQVAAAALVVVPVDGAVRVGM